MKYFKVRNTNFYKTIYNKKSISIYLSNLSCITATGSVKAVEMTL